ncbi:hypothetical protein D3C78_918820 [compost metagenome]
MKTGDSASLTGRALEPTNSMSCSYEKFLRKRRLTPTSLLTSFMVMVLASSWTRSKNLFWRSQCAFLESRSSCGGNWSSSGLSNGLRGSTRLGSLDKRISSYCLKIDLLSSLVRRSGSENSMLFRAA